MPGAETQENKREGDVLDRIHCQVEVYSKMIFCEKARGMIRSSSFCEYILPMLLDWLHKEELATSQPHFIVQDRAPAHAIKNVIA